MTSPSPLVTNLMQARNMMARYRPQMAVSNAPAGIAPTPDQTPTMQSDAFGPPQGNQDAAPSPAPSMPASPVQYGGRMAPPSSFMGNTPAASPGSFYQNMRMMPNQDPRMMNIQQNQMLNMRGAPGGFSPGGGYYGGGMPRQQPPPQFGRPMGYGGPVSFGRYGGGRPYQPSNYSPNYSPGSYSPGYGYSGGGNSSWESNPRLQGSNGYRGGGYGYQGGGNQPQTFGGFGGGDWGSGRPGAMAGTMQSNVRRQGMM